jgi:hypothetical protein
MITGHYEKAKLFADFFRAIKRLRRLLVQLKHLCSLNRRLRG